MSYANVFSGGLFISMAMIHLMPEATLAFNTAQIQDKGLWLIKNEQSSDIEENRIIKINGTTYKMEDKYCQNETFFPFPWAFLIVIVT